MKEINKKMNIFVSCHKDFYVPKNSIYVPIQVGAKNASQKFDMISDDSGDNISELNPYYCELTAQYWVWKNTEADYYGFCHYRRYFIFNEKYKFKNIHYFDIMNDDLLKELQITDDEKIKNTIEESDIIVPQRDYFNLYDHYKSSPNHHIEDLDFVLDIIKRIYPEYRKSIKKVLKMHHTYFLNMYILKADIFKDYCNWLFPILEEFHKSKDYSDASIIEKRTPGFLAERLFSIYFCHLQLTKKDLKIKELPVAFFEDATDPYLKPVYENNTGICFASDAKYAKHLGLALLSLIENTKKDKTYDIVIFDNGFTFHQKELLRYLGANHENISIRFIKTKKFIDSYKLYSKQHINSTSYARLLIPELLRNFDKVIYLDCDLVVNHDIGELYEINLGNNYVAATRDYVNIAWNHDPSINGDEKRKYAKEALGLDNFYDYFNAGVMIFNNKELSKEISSLDLFKLAASRKWTWMDQDVLNKVCLGRVEYLIPNWNVMPHNDEEDNKLIEYTCPERYFIEYKSILKDPYIIHFAGHFQPMYAPHVKFSEIFWKYARKSDFYEELLFEINRQKQKKNNERFHILKKIFPYGTRRGYFARRIYHIFK